MANNTLYFKHPISDETRKAPVGFSWTSYCFTVLVVALFRRDFKFCGIFFGLAGIFILIDIIIGIDSGERFSAFHIFAIIMGLFVPFYYNNMYIKQLLKNGFHVYKAENGELPEVLSNFDFEIPTVKQTKT